MARQTGLPVDRTHHYVAGDSLRPAGWNARGGRRGRAWRGHRNRILDSCAPSRSDGRRWAVTAIHGRLVHGHYISFFGALLFFQDAHLRKKAAEAQTLLELSARRRLKASLQVHVVRFTFATSPSVSLIALLQPLLELRQGARLAPGRASNSRRRARRDGRTLRYPGRRRVRRKCLA